LGTIVSNLKLAFIKPMSLIVTWKTQTHPLSKPVPPTIYPGNIRQLLILVSSRKPSAASSMHLDAEIGSSLHSKPNILYFTKKSL
jgi:hypothetical protein